MSPAPRSHPHSRIGAHVVYNEYIQDKHHIHMNSTRWLTLTDFVKHLGREGLCKVEETPKGWFITLIQVGDWEAFLIGSSSFQAVLVCFSRGCCVLSA